ncbi:Nicotinamidase [Amphibalanus amphitrite]|uniref:nicotinamidase n=1 Tax=Amphibalanus amphitrite TaxID=1232801 RepID=A0A6A4V021_AMPAM|nr:Nicotinamidase [Amphibalanus amphitrite]
MSGGLGEEVCFFGGHEDHLTPDDSMNACFTAFDKDRDDRMSVVEFGGLCRALFRNDVGKPYHLDARKLAEMFSVFDKNEIVRPVSAFLIVDVQNDFINGSLAICNFQAQQKGEEVVPVINEALDTIKFDVVVYSMDWHPNDHLSFVTNVLKYPLHPTSPIVDGALWIKKGHNPEIDSYSAFFDNAKISDTGLSRQLRQRGVTDVFVCGIATDVCVGATATHALDEGFRTILVDDACRGVCTDEIEKLKQNIMKANGVVINSTQVKSMVQGRDRRPELGYKLAMRLQETSQ